MALSNNERQKRWIARNRALFNLRRRLARKEKANNGVVERALLDMQTERERRRGANPEEKIYDKKETLRVIREMVARDEDEDRLREVEVNDPVMTYRDDFGRVISEKQWKLLQEHKEKARLQGYELDEFSQ
jgi:hypothetical protein